MKCIAITVVAMLLGACFFSPDEAIGDKPEMKKQFTVSAIGYVRKSNEQTTIVLDKEVQDGLMGLDGWSHVWVFWWFDRNDNPQQRSILQVHPRGNSQNPLTGVFATRSPVRPNLIALSLCKIVSVKENVIEVERIDAFDATPVLDLKPYIPSCDSAKATVPEWLHGR